METMAVDLSDIDLRDLDTFERGVPHEWFARLRRHAPVFSHPIDSGPRIWVLSRHEDIAAVACDWERNSSAEALGSIRGMDTVDEERWQAEVAARAATSADNDVTAGVMIMMDPPAHTKYRRLVSKAFTPRMVSLLEPGIRATTVRLIEAAISKSQTGGQVDFVPAVAEPIPLMAIAEMLGAPEEDRAQLFAWANSLIGSEDPEFSVDPKDHENAVRSFHQYAANLAEARRAEPRDDMTTALLEAEIDGQRMSTDAFCRFFRLLTSAGAESTRYTTASGVQALIENPDQFDGLRADLSLAGSAVEEILRWATPVMYFRRAVTEDYELHGQQIRKGDKVSFWFISANRDEAVFEDPYTFNIRRRPNKHVAFGGGGPHFCLGSGLARLQLNIMFEELARRVSRIEPVGEPVRLRSNFMNGIKHLPLRLHRA
jgi:cholest-4-en-3-one 26-monooxygenase